MGARAVNAEREASVAATGVPAGSEAAAAPACPVPAARETSPLVTLALAPQAPLADYREAMRLADAAARARTYASPCCFRGTTATSRPHNMSPSATRRAPYRGLRGLCAFPRCAAQDRRGERPFRVLLSSRGGMRLGPERARRGERSRSRARAQDERAFDPRGCGRGALSTAARRPASGVCGAHRRTC